MKALNIILACGLLSCLALSPELAKADAVCDDIKNLDSTKFCLADSRDGSRTIAYSIGAIRMLTTNSGQRCESFSSLSPPQWGNSFAIR